LIPTGNPLNTFTGTASLISTGTGTISKQPFDGVQGDAVALAEPGQNYVVYLPHGGKVTVDLSAAKSELTARWFNPRDGAFGEHFSVAPNTKSEFQSPNLHDWVLYLSANSK
jgi:hypothetical protein